MWLVGAKDMGESQPIWLSGCPIKSNFRAKYTFLAFSIREKIWISSLFSCYGEIMWWIISFFLQAPLKFWILKSYLSPTLKDFLPYYAEKYGFEYEYVQYKWPRWLNQQTDKQRIIWGYKILFLDVMFPLDVKKIIFVDTDQIVRADLTELRDMDLKGAPYG